MGLGTSLPDSSGTLAEEPSCDLPVAAHPAVFAAGMGGVVRRVVVDDFDVGDEAGASVGALDEVVREESVAREAAVEYLVKDGDFVDAFAGEDAFAEEVLIDVGDGAGVDVEAGFAGVEGRKAGARCGGDADADAWLEDAVSLGDDARAGVDDRLIERVRHGADHAGGGAARKLGVGVERDDVADMLQGVEWAGLQGEAVVLVQQEFVEVEELAALALPSHPDALAGVEDAMAMQEEEGSSLCAGILGVQMFDAVRPPAGRVGWSLRRVGEPWCRAGR